ncbi:MAG: hypothetical protein HC905_11585 [Bacteroidales bacterium]|nr:hypothetical protein [Bacteroidales bacterium]
MAYHFIYDKNIRLSRNFNTEINIIIVSVLFSMFGASLFHGQTFFQTAIAQKAIYFFAFYFLLSYIKIHPEELINLMVIFGIAYALVYIAQFIVFPKQLVSSKILEERGTLRIYMAGGEYSYFAYFFALYKFAKTHKVYYIFLMLLFLSIFIMLGSRQLIATIFGITMLFFLLSKQVKSKFAIGLLGFGLLVSVYFQFQEVFNSMFEVSQTKVQRLPKTFVSRLPNSI